MSIKSILIFIPLLAICVLSGCNAEAPNEKSQIVVGISSDIESLNPLFSFSGSEAVVSELLYLSLVRHVWEDEKGGLSTYPMLAERWEWNNDSTSVLLYLMENIKWSDGMPITVHDAVFSLDLYSDPEVESRFLGSFDNLFLENDGSIDIKRSFEILSENRLKVNFVNKASADLFEIDMPLIPQHIFTSVNRKDLIVEEKNMFPVTSGAFRLKKWERTQAVYLEADTGSFLYNANAIEELVFKIIPDYNSRITQLITGEVDIVEDLKTGDLDKVQDNNELRISSVKGREYDFVGWNNIEKNSNGVAHHLFGTASIRKALSLAINREEILNVYLDNKGSVASGPVSPIFTEAYNSEIDEIKYDPQQAKEILLNEGWKDTNNDGILEKNGKKFSFILNIPSGNPRREAAASLIKNEFRGIGIEMITEPVELNVLVEKLFNNQADAWMLGWVISIPLDLRPYWHSDTEKYPLNFSHYNNLSADIILDKINNAKEDRIKNELTKEFQSIIHEDQPVTFLYWVDNIVGYNKRIRNIKINPLGPFNECWNWSVN